MTRIFFILILISFRALLYPASYLNKTVVGFKEKVYLSDAGLTFDALLDTGAAYCTVHAFGMKEKRKNNKMHISFFIKNERGRIKRLSKEVARITQITLSDGRIKRRYAVYFEVKFSNFSKKILFTLSNRRKMREKMLIGRNLLKNNFLVDPSRVYLVKNKK